MRLSVILRRSTGTLKSSPDDVIAGNEGWTNIFLFVAVFRRSAYANLSQCELATSQKKLTSATAVPAKTSSKTVCPETVDSRALNSD